MATILVHLGPDRRPGWAFLLEGVGEPEANAGSGAEMHRKGTNPLEVVALTRSVVRLIAFTSVVGLAAGCGTLAVIPPVYHAGPLLLRGTWCADLDLGVEDNCTGTVHDVWWEQVTDVERYWSPRNGAMFAVWGMTLPTYQNCASMLISTARINGSNDANNQIPTGTYLCGRTSAGRITIVRIVNYGYNLDLNITTYQ